MSAPRDGDPGPDEFPVDGDRPDDREAVDRAFAELVANYHLTADRPDPLPPLTPRPEPPLRVRLDPWSEPSPGPRIDPQRTDPPRSGPPRSGPQPGGAPGWAEDHPLFVGPTGPQPAIPEPDPDERYVPEPQPPMDRPGLPILLAWLGIAYAAVVVLLAAFGVRLPPWTGWLAVGTFMIGFGVLVFHLPRSRPPGDDGAVL